MNNTIKTLFLFLLLAGAQLSYAQTNQDKALAKGREAVKLMDEGKYDESIKLLEEAKKLDPDFMDYSYELAYAYYLKEDYKTAAGILEKLKNHKDVNDRVYQLLGNCYDFLSKPDKAVKAYDDGLEKFPNSGLIYLEKGNLEWNKKDYNKALPFYEKGIEVDPTFASNYYRATKIFCASTEEVWGMIYGEIFMNLERNSKRTIEISKLLYKTYKSEINFTNASGTEFTVSFSKNASMDISDLTDSTKFKLPFGVGMYEPTLMMSMLGEKEIDLNSLDRIRTKFVEKFFNNKLHSKYPNVLFDYQKNMLDAGHFEAYNHWLLMKGDEEAFGVWQAANKDKWDNFVKWFTSNKITLDETHKFYRAQY